MATADIEVDDETRNRTDVYNPDTTDATNLYIVGDETSLGKNLPEKKIVKQLARERYREEHPVDEEADLLVVAEKYANCWEVLVHPDAPLELNP